ncbi:Putative amidoligase enzyme [Marinospirillum celere]|uniref:Putative amidoligase enzyme n=1 Tax=Marinospirillum celere TaxID=1122252 RepID=A0A1I1JI89_9GAMM|nr:amidoligase family protein [Marinospirillum celere]SFC48176.1 Putative amidoligase enzyme [Marinospirillum celere]
MEKLSASLLAPPWLYNEQGDTRRVGVEIEMTGLTLEQITQETAEQLEGQVVSKGRYERQITDLQGKNWIVELDFHLLKQMGREKRPTHTFSGDLGNSAEEALAWFAENLVPFELVSPPLELHRLPEVEAIIDRLRAAGAKGSSDSLVNAFGMQLNPEIPDAETATLTATLKAFLCLYDWLHKRAEIDISRQITSYINPFPTSYVKKVVDPSYWPDQQQLIDDYLLENPTRNRALDCLPLFKHLNEKQVARVTQDPLIKARPTFHYRLPSSEIHDPHWGLHTSWNDWVEVERLAADKERLNACCQAYSSYLRKPLDRLMNTWFQEVESQWLNR